MGSSERTLTYDNRVGLRLAVVREEVAGFHSESDQLSVPIAVTFQNPETFKGFLGITRASAMLIGNFFEMKRFPKRFKIRLGNIHTLRGSIIPFSCRLYDEYFPIFFFFWRTSLRVFRKREVVASSK